MSEYLRIFRLLTNNRKCSPNIFRQLHIFICLCLAIISFNAFAQPAAPSISASDVDSDCFYQISLNAPASTPSNYTYELYEKVGATAWPASSTITRSTALGNIPPFYYVRVDKNIGTYSYRARICITGTASCSGYSNEVAVPVNLNCAGLVAPTVSMTTPSGLVAGQTTTLSATASTTSGSISSVEFYLGGTLIGTDYSSPYSISWVPPAAGSIQVRAAANASTGAVSLTGLISVTVAAPQIPPSVSLSSPSNGTNYSIGNNVPLSASASDSDGTINSVAFYANNVLITSDNSSPYQITTWYPAAGTYDVKAIATDNSGLSTTSATVRITVGKPTVTAQDVDDDCYFTLSLNAPTNVPSNHVYELYEKIPSASVWPSMPVVTRSTGFNPPNVPPFRMIRTDQAPGTYQYQARICIAGACGPMSDIVSVLVKSTCASLVLPSVSITNPIVNQTYAVGQPITIRATATTTQGSIQGVTFNLGGQTLVTDTVAPYEVSWTPTVAGDYLVQAVADGTNGGTKVTEWLSFKAGTVMSSSSSSRSSTPATSSSSSRSSSSSSVAVTSSSSSRSSSSVAVTSSSSSRSSSSVALTSSSRSSNSVAFISSSSSSNISGFDTDNGIVNSTPPSATQTSPVGSTLGNFRVDESGSANYSISILAPEGVAGVKPQISIEYSGQGGVGLVGYGGSISGLGSISRCRQTLLQDGAALPITWGVNDRFCFNGQRLMLVSGTNGYPGSVYKSEIDNSIWVTAVGGVAGNPDYFEVQAKDGSKSLYGQTTDSKVIATSTLTWALSRFADGIGNRIDYSYEGNNSTGQRIKTISYAFASPNVSANPAARIEFSYVDRGDSLSSFLPGGELLKLTKRLTNIISYNGSSIYRKYNFYYNEVNYSSIDNISRLTSVEECLSESSSSCYPKTVFAWGNKVNGFSSTATALNNLPSASKFKSYRYMDFDGDGRQDLVWVRGSGDTARYIEYGRVNSHSSGGMTRQTFSNAANELSYTVLAATSQNDDAYELKLDAIDYNNDGRQDLLVCKPLSASTNCGSWDLYLSVPVSGGWQLSATKISMPFQDKNIKFGDVDADGLLDAYVVNVSGISVYPLKRVAGAATTSNQFYAFSSSPQNIPFTQSPSRPNNYPYSWHGTFHANAVLGDFNGDGKMDIAYPTVNHLQYCTSRCGEAATIEEWILNVYINNGSEFTYSSNLSYVYATEYPPREDFVNNEDGEYWVPHASISKLIVVDLNNDGLSDLLSENNYNWYYQLNIGNGFSANTVLTSIPSYFERLQSVELVDNNRDGYLDVVWHDKKNNRLMYREWNSSVGTFNANTVLATSKPAERSYSFADMNGDGFADLTEFKTDSSVDIRIFYGLGNSSNLDKIYSITDGNNNVTQLSYASLGNSGHYTTLSGVNSGSYVDTSYCDNWTYFEECVPPIIYTFSSDDFYNQINRPFGTTSIADSSAPIMELSGTNYVVIQTAMSAPVPGNSLNLSKVTYYYHHNRMQAGGRGYLGFEKITSVDQQTGVKTETTYHQNWPYVGAPKKTVVLTRSGYKLSEAENTWATEVDSSNNRVRRVFIDKTTETSYALKNDGAEQGASLQTITTDNNYDPYGNATRVEVITSGATNTSTKTTVNQYYQTEWELRMGRLDTSTTTTQRNSEPAVVRASKFEYYGQFDSWPGMLKKEIIEPGANQQVVEYQYDAVGNKKLTLKTANVKAGVSQTRKAEVIYDTSRRFAETTLDSLGNITSGVLERHPVYGLPSKLRDANGAVTDVKHNADGTELQRKDASGAWIHTEKAFCGGTVSCVPGARYKVTTFVSGGGRTTEDFDILGRTLRTSKVMFDGRESFVDTEYDALGRIYRKSEPYFTSEPVYWTVFGYDLINRVTTITAPDNTVTTNVYDGYKTTITSDANGKALKRIEERNSLGNLIKVTDHLNGTITYGYDPLGNLTSATTSASGKTVVVRMCYDKLGRKIAMHDPDKGGFLGNATETCANIESKLDLAPVSKTPGWWFYKYNDFGELIEQTDTKRQVSVMEYDALGRMLKRTDKKSDSSVDTHTRWYYDKALGASTAAPNTQLKLTAVVTSYNSIDETCAGANYCQTYSYDGISRLTDTVTYLPNASTGYINTVKYDTIGRAFKQYDVLHGVVQTSGTNTRFNAYGYPEQIIDLTTGDTLQKTLKMNARGQVKEEQRNNGAAGTTVYTYDDATGRLTNQTTSLSGALFGIQNVTYAWDKLGNLSSRHNQSGNLGANGSTAKKNLQESFCYDGLNRLIKSHKGTLTGGCTLSLADQDQEYDGLGNITRKVGVGTYTYSGKGPHAVTSTTNTGSYTYDDNGNQTSGGGRSSITYSSYDQPTRIVSTSTTTDFAYGPDRARFEKKESKAGVTTTTHYLGNVERIQVQGGTVVEWKRYIAGAIYTVRTNTANVPQATDKSFLFNDHLGSLDIVTNALGKITHSASFDAWGARRSGEDWNAAFAASSLNLSGFIEPLTRRGFTGHEMLDDHGLIHMNGRIYDYKLARFLQADPFIQAATDTQSYNRYSYVINNPLNKTDPSGFLFSKLWKELKPFIGAIVTIVVTIFCPVCGPVVAGMIGGAVGAAVNGGNILQGMVFGAFSGAVGGMGGWQGFLARGVVGGMQSYAAGGKFGHGFMAAGIGGMGGGDGWTGFVQAAVLGGVASEITGGKFKNGAASAAFMYAVGQGVKKYGPGGRQNSPQKSSSSSSASDEESLFNDTMAKMSDTDKVKILVTRSKGQVDITVTGTVESMTASEAQILIDGAKKYWNVSRTASDGTVYTLSVRLESSMFGGGFTLEMKDMPPTKNGTQAFRSHVQGRVMRLWSGDPNISATAAHEFGHIMGFGDQYMDVGKQSVALPGHNGDLMGTGYGIEAYHLRALAAKYGN